MWENATSLYSENWQNLFVWIIVLMNTTQCPHYHDPDDESRDDYVGQMNELIWVDGEPTSNQVWTLVREHDLVFAIITD